MAMWHSAPTLRQPVSKLGQGEWGVLVLVAGAFLLRLCTALGTFLNPDEALHFLIANKLSWAAAYKASLSTAHPPGLIFVLYFWRGLGTSELLLRLPSVIAGTTFCWLFYCWLERAFNRNVACLGLLMASFLSPVIALAAEIRQYAFLLMFMAGVMNLAEQALAQRSTLKMLGSGACVCLAATFHYSALLFAAAFVIYILLRIRKQPTEPGVLAAWFLGQVAVVGLTAFFYFHHIAQLSGTAMAQMSVGSWLANSYFHPGKQSVLLFALARTFGIFQFVFGQLAIGDVAGLAFLASLVVLWSRKGMISAIFLILPFVITCGLATAGKYPYGGTRHSAFLIPFALAGVSVAIDAAAKKKTKVGFVVASCVVALSVAFGAPHRPYMRRADQSSAHMRQAVAFLQANVKPDQTILADYQTGLLLGHYLCEQKPMQFNTSIAGFEEFRCDGLRVISTGPQTQIFSDTTFQDPTLWSTLIDKFGIIQGQAAWVAQAGWDLGLEVSAQRNSFGKNIEVFEFVAPSR